MTQPTIWHVQAAHLALMNWQMAHAHQQQAWQANLHQVLHETEQLARRVEATRKKDGFAAAVLAQSWLRRVSGVDVNHYHDLAAKRAWSDSWATLDGAVRGERARGAAKLDAYFMHSDALSGFHERLGQDPRGVLAALTVQRDSIKPNHSLIGAGASGFLALLMFISAMGNSNSTNKDAKGASALATMLAVGSLMLAGYLVWRWFLAQKKLAAASAQLARTEEDAANYHRFLADPNAGLWLRSTWAAHPLIFEVAVPDAPVPTGSTSSTYVESKVVERQIVVVRCKYCKQYAPVDKPNCEHCGAAGYGSST